jgi:type IV secretion system protein VirB1
VIAASVLSALLAACAPQVGPVTMAAIVTYESGGYPYAIGDSTTRQAYFPASAAAASALATRLLEEGHNIDAGLAQINSSNWARYGLDAASVFEPCANLAAGARIISADYEAASTIFGSGQLALWHALQAYNSGSFWAASAYANGVWAQGLRLARATRAHPIQIHTRSTPSPSPRGAPLLVTLRARDWSTRR